MEGGATVITAYGSFFSPVSSFKYLCRVLLEVNDDLPVVLCNRRWVRQKLVWMTQVIGREVADARTPGIFYVVVVQAVLLYVSEICVISPRICRTLVGLHHRVAHIMVGRRLRRGWDGTWVYPPLAETMVELVIKEVETYIDHRKNTVAQYIVTE